MLGKHHENGDGAQTIQRGVVALIFWGWSVFVA